MAGHGRETKQFEMPELIRLLLRNAALGFAIAALFVALLLISDMGGVGTLVANSDMGLVAVFMLTFFVGLTFASAQMGFAVMSGDWKGDNEDRGRRRLVRVERKLLPVRIALRS